MSVYCPYCKKEVEYKVEKSDLKEFRGIEINTYENVVVCKECHQDLYVNEISKDDIQDMYRRVINNSLRLKPNIFNGYKSFDLELVENII